MTDAPRQIAEFVDYPGMLAAMRARAQARRIAVSSENANCDVGGMPDKYLQKLLGPKPVRRIGMLSLGPVLGVLGVKLVMIEDESAMRQFGGRLHQRNNNLVHDAGVHIVISPRFMRKIGKIGGTNSRKNMGKRKRRKLARKAASARWHKPKIVEIKTARSKAAAGLRRAQARAMRRQRCADTGAAKARARPR